MAFGDKDRGLYSKYHVQEVRGVGTETSQGSRRAPEYCDPGPCFVVAYTTDPYAQAALNAYGADEATIAANRDRFVVTRADGKAKGPYFVLAYTRDPRARAALAAYADSCDAEYPRLAADLRGALELADA